MTGDGLVDADAIAVLLNIPRDTVLDLARRQLIPILQVLAKADPV